MKKYRLTISSKRLSLPKDACLKPKHNYPFTFIKNKLGKKEAKDFFEAKIIQLQQVLFIDHEQALKLKKQEAKIIQLVPKINQFDFL